MVLQQGCRVPVWGKTIPNAAITLQLDAWQYRSETLSDGSWMVILDELPAGGPYSLSISCGGHTEIIEDVYVGEVWICSGASNMDQRVATGAFPWCGVRNEEEEIARAHYPLIRQYSTRIQVSESVREEPATAMTQLTNPYAPDRSGSWMVCSTSTVGSFSATAYFFAKELFEATGLPIGLIVSCYGASTAQAWISREALEAHPALAELLNDYVRKCAEYDNGTANIVYRKALADWQSRMEGNSHNSQALDIRRPRKPRPPMDPRIDQHSPSLLYNGMIAPLIPYAARGVIWYHGDSNQYNADTYFLLLSTLIEDWKVRWARDLTVLIVQCANIRSPDLAPIGGGSFAILREAQLFASQLSNVGLAVTIDIGERDAHPRNKQEVGRRLSLLARNIVHEDYVPCCGPLYDRMRIEGSKVRLFFRHAIGLKSIGPLDAFAIAGKNKRFVRARAKIDGETIIAFAKSIRDPKAVRYAWSDHPIANLYNKYELPASPFRTDRIEHVK
jgi:sialate O-acetylesterase